MEELLKSLKPHRNTKYYQLVLTFIQIINHEFDTRLRLTVEEILEEVDISRPTFYSYYPSVEAFYVDLMEVLSDVIPRYMAMKSRGLVGGEMVRFSYSMKIGVMMGNMKKIAGKYPAVLAPWNAYFDHAVENMAKWYQGMLKADQATAVLKARAVLNELILHDDIYYEDFDAYQSLMLHQAPVTHGAGKTVKKKST